MAMRDPRVDDYIGNAPEFARPILEKIRAAFHKADADIEETIKWGVPYFQKNGLVGGMAAFKAHADIGFWKAKQLSDPEKLFARDDGSSMAAIRFEKVADLPAQRVLVAYIREAIALNDKPAPKRKAVRVPEMPEDFRIALMAVKKAMAVFEHLAPSHQRDYIEWITEAKRKETRARRIAQAVDWIAEGKTRNWKYTR